MKNTVKIRITKMEYKRNCENFWGFGHNHFWVSDLNGVRLIFVEF